MKCLTEMLFFFKTKLNRKEQTNMGPVRLKLTDLDVNIGPIVVPEFQVPPIPQINIYKSLLYVPINIERESANKLILHEVGEVRGLYGSWVDIGFIGALEPKDAQKRTTGKYSLKDFCSHRLELPPQGSAVFEAINKMPDNVTARVVWQSKK